MAPAFRFVEPQTGEATIVDVGCGYCTQLAAARDAGGTAIGIEPDPDLVERGRSLGLDVRVGTAEEIPLAEGSADLVICKVVLPYTEEARAIGSISRLLRPGGVLTASFQGAGYFMRYIVGGPDYRRRIYGVRTLLNTWWYALTGRRLPGFFGDTLYQSERRLRRYYRSNGLRLESVVTGRRFLGLPVFIYHRAVRDA